ncbi:uncharacterized protein Z519_09234 [Cladophialophora bantiana CBS 173.52]|uniref:WD40 repeat-like protein n=1 Tax=Cladophialophora bantiana (strain ATCC 10958 / CBS 173.52 / CDC B-1940 / NIH 8579) TaxID=1442370 RepID=A0A0D2HG72_CLAB1|nr:uncharacterized protein Z519_09234 [Cladophialophora bantiana CBS 173.52]KIW89805.1 hypothetical protein Z519_09234 [Cladophialophora bantiana CBS 173.52]
MREDIDETIVTEHIPPSLQYTCRHWHFSPLASIVRNESQNQALQSVRVIREIPERWSVCLLTCEGHSGSVRSVVFSADGSRIASGSDDNTVRVWDVQTGACEQTLEGHSDTVNSVVFSADGSRIASYSDDKTVRVWDVQTGACEQTLEGHSSLVNSVVFLADGSRVASSSDDKTVRVWDV